MVLGISGVVWSVRLVHTRLSCPFGLWVGLATFEIYLDVLISSQFFQQISLKVVFFLLGAFRALGRCILFHILCQLLLPQLFFGLLKDNEIASGLLPLPRLGNLPPGGLFLRFSRKVPELYHQRRVVSFFEASK